MKRTRRIVVALLAMAALAGAAGTAAAQAEPAAKPHVRVELLADLDAVAPGAAVQLGARFDIDDEWHIYWINPGEAGLPTRVNVAAPGFAVDAWRYPEPILFGVGTPISGYGYEKSAFLTAEAKAPTDLAAKEVEFKGKASWLVCRHVCVPGSQDVSLKLPVAAAAQPGKQAALFAAARQRLPVPAAAVPELKFAHRFGVSAVAPDREFQALFTVTAPPGAKIAPREEKQRPAFAAFKPDGCEIKKVELGDPSPTPRDQIAVKITAFALPELEKGEKLGGLFMIDVIRNGARRPLAVEYVAEIPVAAAGAPVTAITLPELPAASAADAGAGVAKQLGVMLLFAFLGGALLNVMPCVLPVVSIKVLSLIGQARLDRRRIRRHGLAYAAGILVSFAALAAFVAVVKSGGEAVGWGFQFQSPLFVAVLAAVVFVFGLSLLDVFMLTAPAACTLEEASASEGLRGSFLNGVFATVLATPCTAPFLGAAVGFAFTQPIPITFLSFLVVGLGLAFPFLLLAYFPAWTRFMPKPGAWMETFKSVMGFVLMATVVWLLDVLGKQVGAAGLIRTLAWLGGLGFAAWLLGRFGNATCERRARILTGLAAAVIAVGGGALLLRFAPPPTAAAATTIESGGIAWRPFSEKEVQRLTAEGKTIFMDFTAAWCWTCKVNEQTVIETDPVRQALSRFNVIAIRGDWTNRDPEISEFLKRHGRAGVPVYAVIGPGTNGQPVLLPEVITQGMVISALEKAARKT